ncbi:hypothetical protein [Virgisporangium aliadipatigenens]|uniref:hypothetical protein n=1 Tax=Virgisporangium aliadipatigenens TaxID=741659 RepID=UPI0019434172|nr:hypothetical protein [Virgisporangium aliadipatigenens]
MHGRNPALLSEREMHTLRFTGAPELLRLLDRLVRRPRLWFVGVYLPIIYLVGGAAGENVLGVLAERLNRARGRKIIHVKLSARAPVPPDGAPPGRTPDQEFVARLHRLLDAVVTNFAATRKGVRRIRFPYYGAVSWLVGLYTDDPAVRPEERAGRHEAELREFLNGRRPAVRAVDAATRPLTAEVPWYVLITARLTLRGSQLVSRLWPVRAWLVRHPAVRNRMSNLSELAAAFAAREFAPEAVGRMLVDAVLTDLRIAYRRSVLPGTRRGRLSHPVLLLDDVGTDTAGVELLRLLSAARNEPVERRFGRRPRYRQDPLLVVAVGPREGLTALTGARRAADGEPLTPAELPAPYLRWLEELRAGGTHRSWLLPMRLSYPDPLPDGWQRPIALAGMPHGRRSVAAVVVTAMLLGLAAVVGGYVYGHCGSPPSRAAMTRVPLAEERHQCVGVSSGRHRFFADVDDDAPISGALRQDLRRVEERIAANNERALRRSDHVTLVYVGILSSSGAESYQSALEDLLGLVTAQEKYLSLQAPVRLLLANGGDGMLHGALAVDSIVAAAENDPSIVGVLGLGISKKQTRKAMLRLAAARIPMVGTTLTATELATRTTSYYRQVGPTNRRTAAVLAFHAKTAKLAKRARVYYSADPDDLYSSDLKEQLDEALGAVGIAVTARTYYTHPSQGGHTIQELGEQACELGADDVVIYAGRAERFDDLVAGMSAHCHGAYPKLLAGDDVTRFMLDPRDLPRGLTVEYTALATSIVWGEDCTSLPFFVESSAVAQRIRLSAESGDCKRRGDGNAMLAYDAFTTIMTAVTGARAGGGRPHREALVGHLQQIRDEARLTGATGIIDFARKHTVPLDKTVVMLSRVGRNAPTLVLHCGSFGDPRLPKPHKDCPKDTDDVG